jgi:hypothetical protein
MSLRFNGSRHKSMFLADLIGGVVSQFVEMRDAMQQFQPW